MYVLELIVITSSIKAVKHEVIICEFRVTNAKMNQIEIKKNAQKHLSSITIYPKQRKTYIRKLVYIVKIISILSHPTKWTEQDRYLVIDHFSDQSLYSHDKYRQQHLVHSTSCVAEAAQ